ncbi:MAG TPA: amidase [Solirubrobacteraceae bacterium]|jgi:amidase|nr:amidase [Solirubrobacteraceae bacterium]
MSDAAAATDLLYRPVTELAASVRAGELSARELVQTSLDRIEELEPKVNAFVDVFADEALAEADGIGADDPRPFAGVPIAIKNNRGIAGKRLTFAAEFAGDFQAPQDHNIVRRLKEAGFVIVGSTTLPEWGILPVSQARRFGPTNNPWDLTRTPGGSSGGSAAAVAAGMVPIAHGNDGGGSTRIPAACCGLVGLKPQRSRISMAPEVGFNFLATDGVLTRTVAETAQLLDILAGYELGDTAWAPPPAQPFAQAAAQGWAGRRPARIALTTLPPIPDAEVDPVCAQAARDAAELLAGLGHEIVEEDPPWQNEGLLHLFTAVFAPMLASQCAFLEMFTGRQATADDMEPLSWELFQLASQINATQAELNMGMLQGVARMLVTWCAQYDFVLTPGLAEAPVKHDTINPCSADPMADFARSGRFTPFTAGMNISGSPAIALPLYERDDLGSPLPVSVQLIGQPAGEAELLALSAQLEAAHPWADRRAAL